MIEFRGVSKSFGGGTQALADVDLQVADGEFAALLGPSGCGKSTLLNLLAGFETITQGEVRFAGRSVSKPGPDRAVVFQEAALLPWLTVEQNVAFGPQMRRLPRHDYQPRVDRMLALVGLDGFARALPSQLSGGMRQRVGLARALVMEPGAMLMDEPFGALDSQTRMTMQQLLLDVWQTLGTTVLFVTHDIDEAILLADRIFIMSARPGRISRVIPIALARPRSIDSLTTAAFIGYKSDIMREMKLAHGAR